MAQTCFIGGGSGVRELGRRGYGGGARASAVSELTWRVVKTCSQRSSAAAHVRYVLGNDTYESLAGKGEAMTIAAIVAYAYDQIDQARSVLNAVSK